VLVRFPCESKWLLELLNEEGSDWWLRAFCAQYVCQRLDIAHGEPGYYVDIYVWLPDVRWGVSVPCVTCGGAGTNWWFRDEKQLKNCGRRIHGKAAIVL
jgi:hypothetical protein